MKTKALTPFCLAFFLFAGIARSDVRLPAIFSDHMVLLKDDKVPVWGWADPGEKVSVLLNGQTLETKAGSDGKWRVDLNLAESPEGPFEMMVRGNNTLNIKDVVVGEVWLGSGQSNMGQMMFQQVPSREETATAINPMLRQFVVIETASLEPQEEVDGFWLIVKPGQTDLMSPVAYFFGKAIHREIKRPVGIIKAQWGGMIIEPFISHSSFESDPDMKVKYLEKWSEMKKVSSEMMDWLKTNQPANPEATDVKAYLDTEASEAAGWVKVNSTGPISDPVLLKDGPGAMWFRMEIQLTADQIRGPLQMRILGVHFVNFFEVYFNGKLVKKRDIADCAHSAEINSAAYLMACDMQEGVNQLAVKVFSQGRFSSPGVPTFNEKPCDGNWFVKAEYVSANLNTAKKAPSMPKDLTKLPGTSFNGMIHPLIPYAVRGVIWYQGESNAEDARSYMKLMPLLIKDWRNHWGNDRLPFYFCQIANWNKKLNVPVESDWAEVREAQLMALSVPDTGMAVLIDTGEWKDIHPQSKDIAGERLAKIALAKTYGKTIPYSGPLYDSMKVEGDKIRINFKYVEGGLVAKDVPAEYHVMRSKGEMAPLVRNSPNSELEGFAICGADPSTPEGSAAAGKKWVWADAKIQSDNTVLVWSDEIKEPVAVRYGWARNPTCNLYNKADLPASPFRTDDFEVFSEKK